MFDHATCRPRVLRTTSTNSDYNKDGMNGAEDENTDRLDFYTSTIFGPTCDSIDVICRSVLLPKLQVGDWLYFTNMGAYTMAAASCFNGFTPSEKFYVCSVMPEYFEAMIAGPPPIENHCYPLKQQHPTMMMIQPNNKKNNNNATEEKKEE
jgi:Pyridoxal-dependent decarboxylase, C-terminal sheet domain